MKSSSQFLVLGMRLVKRVESRWLGSITQQVLSNSV